MCTNLTPIPSKCDSKVLWGNALVKGSARLFALSIFATTTSPRTIIFLMMWYFLSMCFPFLWFLGFRPCWLLGLVPLNPIVWCYVWYYVWHYVCLNIIINKSVLLLSEIMVTWIFRHYHIVHEMYSMWFMWKVTEDINYKFFINSEFSS